MLYDATLVRQCSTLCAVDSDRVSTRDVGEITGSGLGRIGEGIRSGVCGTSDIDR